MEGSPASFSIGECVSYGWKAYWKNVGPLLLITLVIIVIDVVISGIGQATGDTFIAAIFSLIGWIVGLLLAFGLIRATIAITKGEKPEVAMLFQTDGFGPYIGHHDPHALGQELLAQRPADASGAPGDHGHLSFELVQTCPPKRFPNVRRKLHSQGLPSSGPGS